MNEDTNLLGKTILLDNNNYYQLIWITMFKEKKYTYLLNSKDYSDLIFCEFVNDDTLLKITNKEELLEIMNAMNKEMNIFIR